MSDTKISALPSASALTGVERLPISQRNQTRGATATQISDATVQTIASFVQSGASAIARTMQSKGRDIYSAKDDGAVGDGVTDDKTKITNTMADSTVVLLPNNGTYICASRLNIPSSLIGPATLKSTAVASGGDFGITGNNITIRDVTFTGSQ